MTNAARITIHQSTEDIAAHIIDVLIHRIGKDKNAARPHDWLAATIYTMRDEIIENWMASTKAAHAAGAKRVYYLSLEFLIGRLMRDAISNLGQIPMVEAALESLGVSLATSLPTGWNGMTAIAMRSGASGAVMAAQRHSPRDSAVQRMYLATSARARSISSPRMTVSHLLTWYRMSSAIMMPMARIIATGTVRIYLGIVAWRARPMIRM